MCIAVKEAAWHKAARKEKGERRYRGSKREESRFKMPLERRTPVTASHLFTHLTPSPGLLPYRVTLSRSTLTVLLTPTWLWSYLRAKDTDHSL